MTYINFKLDIDADGIVLITWDAPGRSMNVIDLNVIDELSDIVEMVAGDRAIRGAVITSGKAAFCAGADLTMLEATMQTFAERVTAGERLHGRFQHGEVRAGTKRRLARSDDRASDCAIAGNHLDDIGKLIDDVEIDDIHRTAGRVPSDKHDAVCIDIELEIDVSHGTHSASVASSAAFRVSLARLA